MTPRQSGILIFLFTAGVVAAGISRPGNWEMAIGLQPEPVGATIGPVAAAIQTEPPKPSIRVILASPYEAR